MTTTAMVDVYELNREQFIGWLDTMTTPQIIYGFASEIYAYLSGLFNQNCLDSVLREWAFSWACERMNMDYDEIYQKWIRDKDLTV